MIRTRIAATTSTIVGLGLTALLFVACAADPNASGETSPNTVGGAKQDPDQTGEGGSAQTSSRKAQGGSTQKSTSSKPKGGAAQVTDEVPEGGEGGSGSGDGGGAEDGGTSPVSKGGSSSKAGFGSRTTGGTKATGGSKATDGSGTKAAGGAVNASKGGSTAKGGSSAKGGSTAASSSSPNASSCTSEEEKKFSFFLASDKALQTQSGSPTGFGGKLGGLAGADQICQAIAETSAPCHKGTVTWHAFLSTKGVNAKDRIGKGPWYDRRGRLVSKTLTDLLQDRPAGADASIKDDLPNENGVPNHKPDGTEVDNHEILTGTGTDGKLYTQSASSSTGGMFPGMGGGSTSCGPKNEETWNEDAATCWGWTTSEGKGCPRVGHSWPRQMSGTNWMSVWNEGGCAPGGVNTDSGPSGGGLDGTRRVGSAGGYGGFYCFAVTGE